MHAHMSSSCSFMCLEAAKLGKSWEPCSAAWCMQNGGIFHTASQPCASWPCKMAEALRASYACPLHCLASRARQPSMHQVSAVPLAILPEEGRETGDPLLWPWFLEPLAKSTSKTIEVNLKVSLVCLGFWLFSFPLFYCVSCLLFLFFTGLASILLLQLKLCPVTELHIGFA